MSFEPKRAANSSEFEVDDLGFQAKLKTLRLVESARTGLSVVALLCGITILGVSADALTVYNATHLSPEYRLPLWPDNFNVRPTVALVAGSAVVVAAHMAGLACGKVKMLRDLPVVHTVAAFAAPAVALTASIIAMVYFYVVNASREVDTVQSWSCRWANVPMMTRPHFGTLCKQSRAGLTLTILLIPLEVAVLGVAAYEVGARRSASAGFSVRRKGSSGSGAESSGHSQI